MSDTHDHEIAKAVLYNHLSADTQDTVEKAIEVKADAHAIAKEVKGEAQHIKKQAEDRAEEIAKRAKKDYKDSALQAALSVEPDKLRERANLIEQAIIELQKHPMANTNAQVSEGGAYLTVWCGFQDAVSATNQLNDAAYQLLYMLNECVVDMIQLRDNLNVAADNYELLDEDKAAHLGGKAKDWAGDEWAKAQDWYGDQKAKAQAFADNVKAKVQGWEDGEKEKAKDWWQNKPEPEPEPEPEIDPVTGQPVANAAAPLSAASPQPPVGANSSTAVQNVAPETIYENKQLETPDYNVHDVGWKNDSSEDLLNARCSDLDSDAYLDIYEVIYGRSACIELSTSKISNHRSWPLDLYCDMWTAFGTDTMGQLSDPTKELGKVFDAIETWSGAGADAFAAKCQLVKNWLDQVQSGCAKLSSRAESLNDAYSTLYDKHVSASGVFDGEVQHKADLETKYDTYTDLISTDAKKDDDTIESDQEDIAALASASDTIVSEFKGALDNLADSPWSGDKVTAIAATQEEYNPTIDFNPDFNPVDPFDPQSFDPADPFGPYGPFGPGGLIKPWKHRDNPDNPPDPVDPGHDFPHRLPDPGSDDDGDSSDIPSLPDDGDTATDDVDAAGLPGMPTSGRTAGSSGPSVKAASYGGGGGGGVPSMPLGPATPGDGSLGSGAPGTGAGAGAGAGAGVGRGIPAGAMGGMGGAPMGGAPGGGGKGQQDSKGKRGPQEDEALYTEDRAWTEAVIGNRPRKAATDNKGSK